MFSRWLVRNPIYPLTTPDPDNTIYPLTTPDPDNTIYPLTTPDPDNTIYPLTTPDPDNKGTSDDLRVIIPAVAAGLVYNLLIILVICLLVVRAYKKMKNRVGVVEDSDPQIATQSKMHSVYFYAHEPTE